MEAVTDPRSVLWTDRVNPSRARAQHDALAEAYRLRGIRVHYIADSVHARPNLFFVRDTFAMTPWGAILSHPATASRSGEESIAARALRRLGIPIVLAVDGDATFEGADLMIVNRGLAFVAESGRTNAAGATAVENCLRQGGIGEVIRVAVPTPCLHLDCTVSIVSRDLACIHPGREPANCREALLRHGFRVLELPDAAEAERGMSINMVAPEPGVVLMSTGNPQTRRALEDAGVTAVEVDVSELMKGAGGIHCMTGVLEREEI
jgi:arginine deiminase